MTRVNSNTVTSFQQIKAEDILHTDTNSLAIVTLQDDCTLFVRPDAQLTLQSIDPTPAVTIARGITHVTATSDIIIRSSLYELKTANATIQLAKIDQTGWIQIAHGEISLSWNTNKKDEIIHAGTKIEFSESALSSLPLTADELSAIDILDKHISSYLTTSNKTLPLMPYLHGSSNEISDIFSIKKLERQGQLSRIEHNNEVTIGLLSAIGNIYTVMTSTGLEQIHQGGVRKITRFNSAEY